MDFKRLDKVFDWVVKQNQKGITKTGLSKKKQEKGSNLSNSSAEAYKYTLHTFIKEVCEKHNLKDETKIKPKHTYDYYQEKIKEHHEALKKGDTKTVSSIANHLRRLDDAIHSVKEFSKESGLYKLELRMGDKRKLSEMMNKEKVYRKSKYSTVKVAKRQEIEEICRGLQALGTPAGDLAADVLWTQFLTGRRISAVLRTDAGDYNKLTGVLCSFGDKGGKDNINEVKKEAQNHLNSKVDSKKTGTRVFNLKYEKGPKKGQDKSVKSTKKHVSALIKQVTTSLGFEGISSHSARKGLACEEAEELMAHFYSDLSKKLNEKTAADPKLKSKVDSVLKNIRAKFKNPERAQEREFTKVELVKILVSIEISHSRTDVMRYYMSNEFWASTGMNFDLYN